MSVGTAPDRSVDEDDSSYADRQRFVGAGCAMATAAVFALLGVFGFIPGITKHIDFKAGERFSGPASHAMLFAVFQTSVLANLIFLGFGVLFAVSSFFAITSRLIFFAAFVVYGFLFVYGISIDRSGPANFLPVNLASAWLHLGIAVVTLVVGIVLAARARHTARG